MSKGPGKRIHGWEEARSDVIAVGRLCRVSAYGLKEGILDLDYNSHEEIGTFMIPSRKRHHIIHVAQVDFVSGECDCGCEDWKTRQKIGKTYYWGAVGTDLEKKAHEMGFNRFASTICRTNSGLCFHLRKCRAWLKRHCWDLIEIRQQELTERLEAIEARSQKTA